MDRVLEIGGHGAGYAGRLFVQAGAQVTRVDSAVPVPAWASEPAMDLFLHAGKTRVTVAHADELAVLAETADVVILQADNAQAVEALNFDRWAAPVKVAITPFGRTGPKKNWHAAPNTLLAMGGYTVLMGDADREPLTLPGHYVEFQAGTLAFAGANSLMLAASRQSADISMLETVMSLSQFTTVRWHCAGTLRTRHGSDFWFITPSEMFACQDGWVYINIVPRFWDAFTVFVDQPELFIDPRFTNNELRMANREALHTLIAGSIAQMSVSEVNARAAECRVPVGVVTTLRQVLEDPHLAARDIWQSQSVGGQTVSVPKVPYRVQPWDKCPQETESSGVPSRRGSARRVRPSKGPLDGIRILDMTHIWAGPLAVRFLADMGADVVRLEAPSGRGPRQSATMPIGGWLSGSGADEPWNNSAMFAKFNRNRRSLVLDLKQAEGRETFLQLVAQADVLVENFSVRAMPGLGLGYADLLAVNPQLIYVAMPGFGLTGPLCDRVAFGPITEVMSGFTQMMGYDPENLRNTAMAMLDPIAATHAAGGVLDALRQRQRSGCGALVELSLHEGGVAFNGPWLIDTQLGPDPVCMGNRHPRMAPHGVYRCAGDDQWVAVACVDEAMWHRLRNLLPSLGEIKWSGEEPSGSCSDTCYNKIDQCLSAWTGQRTKEAAAAELQAAGIAAGPVNQVPDMVADAQVQARGFFVQYERYNRPMPGNPIQLEENLEEKDWRRSPLLGEHNAEILSEWLGMSAADIQALADGGVICTAPPR